MSLNQLQLSQQSLLEALAEDIPATAEYPQCDYYAVPFGQRADVRDSEGRGELAAACRFLGGVASLRLKPDNPQQPFEPYLVMHNVRSPILDDVTDEQLRHLADVAAQISDPELRARVTDVLWIRQRNHNAAQAAVAAYVESGMRILAAPLIDSWAIERFERALQIAAMLGKHQPLFADAVSIVEQIASDVTKSNVVVARCLDLLLQYSKREPEELARVAEVRTAKTDMNPIWQRRFCDLATRFYARAEKEADANRCAIEIGKTFEREAEESLRRKSAPAYLTAAHFLESAIQAYRKVSGTESDRERVQLQLVSVQRKAIKELPTFSSEPIDLSDSAHHAREKVRGKPFIEALRILALAGRIPSVSQMRSDAEEDILRHPMAFLFPASTLSRTGKVVAKQGAMSSQSEGDRESVVRRQMYWYSERVHRPLNVVGVIEPMRSQILEDHYVRYSDFRSVVEYNPLVPQGREFFFVRGLYAGLHGDFVEALHILIPQFENSVRCLLAAAGVVTSSLDANGIQQELDLNSLLYEPKLTEMFGDDIVFELRGLLVEQSSSNFRNQLAHGMLEYGSFVSDTAVYTWWLILRLCLIAVLSNVATPSDGLNEGT